MFRPIGVVAVAVAVAVACREVPLHPAASFMQVMDFGYPQFTEAKILSEFIKTDAYKMEVQARPPMAVTNAVSWRSEGIKYKKNEVHCTAQQFQETPSPWASMPAHCMVASWAHMPLAMLHAEQSML